MFKAGLFILPLVILYGIRKYIESKWSKCKNKIKLDGKLVIITGANSGIGFEVAKDLAARNANIILACRNVQSAEDAIRNIKEEINYSGTLIPMELDLASIESVRNFAENFKKNYKELHVLINNAGVSYPKNVYKLTKDYLEIHFGVNHLGHFYLTNLLLDLLEKSRPSRVIFVSSKLHEKGKINIEDLNSESSKQTGNLYSNSKLANAYTCKELALRTKNKGTDVFAVCPGWIYTNLFRHSIKWYHYILVSPIALFFMRSAKQGAQTIIYCATEPGLESGMIYRDCKVYKSSHQFNPKVAMALWNKSEEIIKQNT